MIYWMSDEVDRLWDEANSQGLCLYGFVCEVHDPEMKGHIVIEMEIGDDFSYQLHLGDCTGLADEEINERFVRRFDNFVKAYEDSDDWCEPVVEDLERLRDCFLKTIENKKK